MAKSGNVVPTIVKAEHIGPEDTGDNIEAKRVAGYGFGTDGNWKRNPLPLIDSSFDSMTTTYPDSVTEVYTFKAGATTVSTLTIVYTDASKGSLSSFVRS